MERGGEGMSSVEKYEMKERVRDTRHMYCNVDVISVRET